MSSLKTYKQDDQFLELVNMNRLNEILDQYKEQDSQDTFYLSKD